MTFFNWEQSAYLGYIAEQYEKAQDEEDDEEDNDDEDNSSDWPF